MKKISPALIAAALLPLASIVFTACESMSPDGAQDALDAAHAGDHPAAGPAATTSAASTPAAPASRAADYPHNEPLDPSTLPPSMGAQLMPIPEPVPRR